MMVIKFSPVSETERMLNPLMYATEVRKLQTFLTYRREQSQVRVQSDCAVVGS